MASTRVSLALVVWIGIAGAAWACSLCSNPINRATLGEEMDLAPVAVYGWLSEPRFDTQRGLGAGTTQLHIDKILKDEGGFGAVKQYALSRYVPVSDPKQPPRYLVFLEKGRERFELLAGVAVKSPALLEYIEGAKLARKQGRVKALVYYARFLGHADDAIANDAFVEFAKSKDADVGEAGRLLQPESIRQLLGPTQRDPDRLSLFAFLLGCCGDATDADLLLRLGRSLDAERVRALDGILAGYVNLRPREGWQAVHGVLADPKQAFTTRLAAWRTTRFLHGWKPVEFRAEILRSMEYVVQDGELADLGVEDLRRWKVWELTKAIALQFERPTHQAPIIRNSIIRYALSCPLPEAREVVAKARRLDPDYVADQEKLLADLEGPTR